MWHQLINIDGERPAIGCNAHCRGAIHAHLVWLRSPDGNERFTLASSIQALNPFLLLLDLNAAPEALRPRAVPPVFAYGFVAHCLHPLGIQEGTGPPPPA